MRLGLAVPAAVVVLVLTASCGGTSPSPNTPGKRGTSEAPGQKPAGAPAKPAAAECADPQSDPRNCGTCGFACSFANATPLCSAGTCVRGPCAPGWHDLDGDPGTGCEASCSGVVCTIGSGPQARTVTLSAPPLPESGAVAGVFASSGARVGGAGDAPADPPGVLGEATPLPCAVGPEIPIAACLGNENQLFENQTGYQAVLR